MSEALNSMTAISVSARREAKQIVLTINGAEIALGPGDIKKLVSQLEAARYEVVRKERPPVDQAERARRMAAFNATFAVRPEELSRHLEELRAEDEMALRIIRIGYKKLAAEMKSNEDMTQLKRIRSKLDGAREHAPEHD
jgi:hypothetical protein